MRKILIAVCFHYDLDLEEAFQVKVIVIANSRNWRVTTMKQPICVDSVVQVKEKKGSSFTKQVQK